MVLKPSVLTKQRLQTLGDRLLDPFTPLQDDLERQRIRATAFLFLVFLFLEIIILPVIIIVENFELNTGKWFFLQLSVVVLTGMTYVLVRRQRVYLASSLLIGSMFLFMFVSVIVLRTIVATHISFMILLFALYLLPVRGLLVVWVLLHLTIFSFWLMDFIDVLTFMAIAVPIFTIAMFALVFERYRNRIYQHQNAQIQTSEARYKMISELMSDYAFAAHRQPDGIYKSEWMTDSFRRVTGYDIEELGSTPKLYHPDEWEKAFQDMQRVMQGEDVRSVYRMIRKDGEQRWLEIYRRPVWDAEQQRVARYYGVAKDITQRKEAEDALRQREEYIRRIIENANDIIYTISEDGVFEYVSPNWTAALGHDVQEVVGQHFSQFVFPDDLPICARYLQRIISTGAKQGGVEYRVFHKDGSLRWHMSNGSAVFNDEGHALYYVGVARDITSHKQNEARKLKDRLEQERLQLMQRFALALSHDFRTSLSTMETSRYLIQRYLEQGTTEKISPKLDAIGESVEHLRQQLDNMSALTGLMHVSKYLTDINALIHSSLQNCAERMTQNNDVQVSFTPLEKSIVCELDAPEVEQALCQVLKNAHNHSPAGGTIHIKTYIQDGLAVIEVQDEGEGILPEKLPFIFDYFYRADDARPLSEGGIGLGLSIVRMVMEAHDGHIVVESQPGQGSTFRLYFPLYELSLSED